MNGPERRETPRKTLDRFAYINIEPSNGGSVLNVSEGGLCFHSIAPVHRNKTIHFWFCEHDHRIDVQSELVWIDEAQRTGGLRFEGLPTEAREPIRRWISPPVTAVAANRASPLSALPLRASPALGTSRLEPKVGRGSSEPFALVARQVKVQAPLTGFSGGMATGLLIAAFLAAPALFHSYKRQLGESLIQWGERFAARPHVQMPSVSPALQTAGPPAQSVVPAPNAESPLPQKMASTSPTELPPPKSIPLPVSKKLLLEPLTRSAKSRVAQIVTETRIPTTSTAVDAAAPKASAVSAAEAISTTASTIPLRAVPFTLDANVTPAKPRPPHQIEPANGNHIQNGGEGNFGSSSQMYFEVGKFKDESWAYRTTDNLARLGFRATVVEKGHFWTNSYHVLVGPYDDDERAEGIRKKLVSGGFKPQVFERGSRTFTIYGGCDTISRLLRSERTPNRIQMPVQDCVIRWETYSTHAMVKFGQENNIIATADGKWVQREVRYEHDAFVYRRNDDGSRTLIEIWFAGMRHALVFDNS
jgi:hypothetical protein